MASFWRVLPYLPHTGFNRFTPALYVNQAVEDPAFCVPSRHSDRIFAEHSLGLIIVQLPSFQPAGVLMPFPAPLGACGKTGFF